MPCIIVVYADVRAVELEIDNIINAKEQPVAVIKTRLEVFDSRFALA